MSFQKSLQNWNLFLLYIHKICFIYLYIPTYKHIKNPKHTPNNNSSTKLRINGARYDKSSHFLCHNIFCHQTKPNIIKINLIHIFALWQMYLTLLTFNHIMLPFSSAALIIKHHLVIINENFLSLVYKTPHFFTYPSSLHEPLKQTNQR